jgi:vitamin B12 transporter
MKKLLFIVIILVTYGSWHVQGQIALELDSVVITTSHVPQTARQTGRNVTVITKKTIAQSYATSFDDLLQQISGIEVQSRGGFGAQGDITMRGSTYTQVLVLIDGMKLNDPLTAHFNGYMPVSISEIERIEVLRGAAAAMYGADAVGGVINVITKGSKISGADYQDISGEVNLGQHKLVQANQGWGIKKDRFYFGGGFSMNQADGERFSPKAADGSPLEEYNSYFDIKTVGLAAGYKWKDGWQLNARTAYDYRDFAARYFYTTSAFDKSTETTRNWWNQVRVSKVGNNSSTDINLAYKYNTDEFIFSPDFSSTNNHISKLWNLNIGHLIAINSDISLRLGGQIDRRAVESTDRTCR